jgi:hypothetical protein
MGARSHHTPVINTCTVFNGWRSGRHRPYSGTTPCVSKLAEESTGSGVVGAINVIRVMGSGGGCSGGGRGRRHNIHSTHILSQWSTVCT